MKNYDFDKIEDFIARVQCFPMELFNAEGDFGKQGTFLG